ncbi:MAG TPA: carboxypeptidase-like regulatory domain-containing protein [Acidobacteriaceae bacterium]|nr:carboxypeptidase-like regulatory domain-containing protein [Acidobacteriaceae bacterium]
MQHQRVSLILVLSLALAVSARAQSSVPGPAVPAPTDSAGSSAVPANISGTISDDGGDVIPNATVTLLAPDSMALRTTTSADTGAFSFDQVPAGGPYRVAVHATGFADWTSADLELGSGQFAFLPAVHLTISGGVTSVVVVGNPVQLATEQVHVAEQQRVLGIVPNFYVVYDANPAPLTTKLKFSLALRAETDPVTFAGAAFISALQQAGDTPDYQQGMAGYGQRLGANYTTGFTDIMIGGALLPSLLHQDPRYFYQGTGSTGSRLLHALSAPFVARGDNGHLQPNYSSIGGDVAAGAISNAYEPSSNRGAGLVFENALLVTGGRMANAVAQEFVLRRLTAGGRRSHLSDSVQP